MTKDFVAKWIVDMPLKLPPVKITGDDVYGAEILRLDNQQKLHKDFLETWEIKIPFAEDYDGETYFDIVRRLIEKEEWDRANELETPYSNITQYCLSKEWAVIDDGRDSILILRKYAKCLKDIEE